MEMEGVVVSLTVLLSVMGVLFVLQSSITGEASETVCQDSDGENYYNKGTIAVGNTLEQDYCAVGSPPRNLKFSNSCSGEDCFIVEYACANRMPYTTTFRCERGCHSGACL